MQHFKIYDASVSQDEQRRMYERYPTVLEAVKIVSERNEEVGRLRGIFSDCAVADVSGFYRGGEEIVLDLTDKKSIKARVAWALNKSVGLKLRTPIDLAVILLGYEAKSLQFCRHELNFLADGKIVIGPKNRNILIEDISQGGIRILCGVDLLIGSTIDVYVTGLTSVSATVRWSNAGKTGLSFHDEIDFNVLQQWLNAHHYQNLAAPCVI